MGITVVTQPGRVTVVREEVASPRVVVSPNEVVVNPGPDREIDVTQSPRSVEIQQGGMQGPPGTDGDKHYRHVQAVAALQWTIDHDLDKFPAVSVVDSSGTQVEGAVEYTSQQQVVVTFTAAFAGEAYLN